MALDATFNIQHEQQQQHQQQIQNDEKVNKNRLSNYLSNLLYNNKRDLTKEMNGKNGGNFNFILNNSDEKQEESRIISTNDFQDVELSSENSRLRVALGVLVRLVLPLLNGFTRGWHGIRGIRILKALRNVRESRGMLTNLLAYTVNTVSMSLSSVQVVHKMDPLLRAIKLKKAPNVLNTSESVPNFQTNYFTQPSIEDVPEKCVVMNILAEPPEGTPIRADIIFIHGLHGSLVNTWKQGLWNKNSNRVKFERPPKPPVRPPKRPRHSRTTFVYPPHQSKRPRYYSTDGIPAELDGVLEGSFPSAFGECSYMNNTYSKEVSYVCEEPDETQFCDELEYSFPTFRLRVDDADQEQDPSEEGISPNPIKNNSSNMKTDPSYSPCWPGDWLPLDCPGVRVIALNYTTDPYLWRPFWVKKRNRTNLLERTREMTDLLLEKKVGIGHPIVWVGHSKGGIFVKKIIVDAYESGLASAEALWRSSRGTLFYSVPHRGSPLCDFNLPLLRQSVELLEIQKNCAGVLELHRRFVSLYRGGQLKIKVFSFVETAMTLMSMVLYLRIVGVDSADPGIGEVCGVHLDHREICKPRNRDCILYRELTNMINKVS